MSAVPSVPIPFMVKLRDMREELTRRLWPQGVPSEVGSLSDWSFFAYLEAKLSSAGCTGKPPLPFRHAD